MRILQRCGCGVAADPDKPEEVAQAIRTVLHNPEQLRIMGTRAREAAFSYDKVHQLDIFVRAIEGAARK